MKINAWGPINRFKQSEDYYLLDFLSDDARNSIVYNILKTLDDVDSDTPEQNIFIEVRAGLHKHGLGYILSPMWRYQLAEAVAKHYASYVKDNH